MVNMLIEVFVFLAGIILYYCSAIPDKMRTKKFIYCVCSSIVILPFFVLFITWKINPANTEFLRISLFIGTAFISTCIVYMCFKSSLLPKVNEESMLFATLIFWLIFLTTKGFQSIYVRFVFVAIPLSLVTVIIAVINATAPTFLKNILYVWNLLIITSICAYQFLFVEVHGKADLISLGVFVGFMANHIIPVLEFMPGKHEVNYWGRVKEHSRMLSSKFSNRQMQITPFLVVFLIAVLILFINLLYSFFNLVNLAALMIAFSPEIFSAVRTKPEK